VGRALAACGGLFRKQTQMPRQPKWTNEVTREVAYAILAICRPKTRARTKQQQPIDWEQVTAFLEAHRDAAISKRDKARKRPKA
jgi:hypothetical protein